MSARVLLADDDASLRFVLSQALSKEGYSVRATSSVSALVKWVRDGEGDAVLSDVYMGDECVFDVLPAMRAMRPNLPIIVMSAQSTVTTALTATNVGAFDYIPKPFDLDDLLDVVRRALEGEPDAKSRAQATQAVKVDRLPLIGRSRAMQEVYRIMSRVAGGDLTILIEGESGAGKERVARALHEHSNRASGAFVVASLAGASAGQVERELLGPDGKIARADGGTLYLEGVDELASEAQARVAALIRDAGPEAKLGARIIAACQRSLDTLVKQGAFRQDLFYRLSVVSIRLPPLRDRLDDVADLARAFLVRAKREGLPNKTLDHSAVERLKRHTYPGNVRELENVLRRVAAMVPAKVITAHDLDEVLASEAPQVSLSATASELEIALANHLRGEFARAGTALPASGLYERLLTEVERPLLTHTLDATHGNQIKAAAVLGINRNTLRKKIQALGIRTGRGD